MMNNNYKKTHAIFLLIVFVGVLRVLGELVGSQTLIKTASLFSMSPAPSPYKNPELVYRGTLICKREDGTDVVSNINHDFIYRKNKSQSLVRAMFSRLWESRLYVEKYLADQFCDKNVSIMKYLTECNGLIEQVEYKRSIMNQEEESMSIVCGHSK